MSDKLLPCPMRKGDGSGTTGVACKQLGIPFEGYDINEDYCEIARSRIQMVDEMEGASRER